MTSQSVKDVIASGWRWLFSVHDDGKLPTDPVDVLLRQCHLTSKCRYNASIRLRFLGRFTFLTTVLLSLVLILMPMLQLASLTIAYPAPVIKCLQIFMAVAVLVYSIISATSGYDRRAWVLNDCADRIKDLSRELRTTRANGSPNVQEWDARYSGITRDSEIHSQLAYTLAMLQATGVYKITGLRRAWLHATVLFRNSVAYAPSALLLVFAAIVVLDIIGNTAVLTDSMAALTAPK